MLMGWAESKLPLKNTPTIGAQKKVNMKDRAIMRAVITPFIDPSPAGNAKSFAF
jgi:hypothetical protein